MSWRRAKLETLAEWRRIRAAIERRNELQLLTDINAAGALCEEARAAAGGARKCTRCAFFEQFGGCSEINGLMSEKVFENEWEELRALVDAFLLDLERLDVEAA